MAKAIKASELSLAERARLLVGAGYWQLNGVPSLGIDGIWTSDGPNGLRRQLSEGDNLGSHSSEPAICFPTESCVACSFDTELVERMGAAIASEAISQGVDIVLGPGVNMKRSPLAGRNFEYFSEDPLLSGKLAAAYVKGLQRHGIGCALKHFAANNQETDRLISDSVVDDIALHELYLEPFRICVQESEPETIMPAYNLLNGTYCCENELLLTKVARDDWGFGGAFISDWGAESSNERSLAAGLDIVMPGPRADYVDDVIGMLRDGRLSEDVLDRAAERILELEMRHDEANRASCCPPPMTAEEGNEVALRLAEQSAVLLENDGLLPLQPTQSICVIGAFAKEPRYQGVGSSRINPTKLTNLVDSLQDHGVELAYCEGYDAFTGCSAPELIQEAVDAASRCDVAIVVIGLPGGSESEGIDRSDMMLPSSHIELVDAICAANSRTCVILQCGAPVELGFAKKPAALLLPYLGGSMGGLALARLLLGMAAPSGKLAETWPKALSDTPCYGFFPAHGRQALYMESIFNGYRYYDAAGVDVAYPFGYGLSYTSFAYSDLRLHQRDGMEVAVTCNVENTGTREGAEIVQAYVSPPQGSAFMHAPKRLAGFAKVFLKAGESIDVTIHIGRESFMHWDPSKGRLAAVSGDCSLHVGPSSRDLALSCMVSIDGDAWDGDVRVPPAYEIGSGMSFDEASFRELYGRDFPPTPRTTHPFTQNSTIADIKGSLIGSLILKVMVRGAKVLVRGNANSLRLLDSLDPDMPLRALSMSGVDMRTIEGAVEIFNLHPIRGLRLILKGLGSLIGKVSKDK